MLLGQVNAGTQDFAAALRDLDVFRRRWPAVVRTLIAGRYPPEQAPDLILGRPAGIKSVITFDAQIILSGGRTPRLPAPVWQSAGRPRIADWAGIRGGSERMVNDMVIEDRQRTTGVPI